MLDAGKFKAPISGETENAYRELCDKADLTCQSGGTGPAQSAVAIKTAIAALQGKVVPQEIALPTSVDYLALQAGQERLPEPAGQLLCRQQLPELQYWLHRRGNRGADGQEQLGRDCAAGASPPRTATWEEPDHERNARRARFCGWRVYPSIMAACGRWKTSNSPAKRVRSTRSWARTAPANPPSSRSSSGVVQPDRGRDLPGRQPVSFATPGEAPEAGISCIFQELSLLPDLSVADNICITDPPRRFGLIDKAAQRRRAEEMLARIGGEDIHPSAPVRDLPLSRQQMVEIAKALARHPRVLILDEATSALTAADVAKVFALLKRLRAEGMAIIYISHRMHEIAELADDCTVFRNGRYVETFKAGTKSDDAIVEMMIGREYSSAFPPLGGTQREGSPALAVKNLSWTHELKNINLAIHPGEVVGLGGLDGQGQRQFLLALFGALIGVTGQIELAGNPVKITSPRQAKSPALGLALIPEDRKNEGLMLPMTVRENLSFAAARRGQPLRPDRPSRGDRDDRRGRGPARHQVRRTRRAGRRALRRQPAEGGDRQMADDQAARGAPQRPNPRASTSAPNRKSTSCCAALPRKARRSSSTRPTMTS